MKPHEIVSAYRSLPGFGHIASMAADLDRQGLSPEAILQAVSQTYGPAPYVMAFREKPVKVNYFGTIGDDFDYGVVDQIVKAAKLPVARAAAVMPDAHPGYGLPIGGVVALENAVSPYFVGVDIACRMTMTILDIAPRSFEGMRLELANVLENVTAFGLGAHFPAGQRRGHPVLDDPLWDELPHLKRLRSTAHSQLGSSGGGNHFADLMVGTWFYPTVAGIPDGLFVALVTHSGSRNVGSTMAKHYAKLAKKWTDQHARGIPPHYEWLPLDTDEGREYWRVMQLMGRYAQANHHIIHDLFCHEAGIKPLHRLENHHNFAWEENGLIVHRKGATPAHENVLGIVPGSMATTSFVVEGLGNPAALNSSPHGAGRVGSRKQAKLDFDREAYNETVYADGIITKGVATDETYQAYKNIEVVLAHCIANRMVRAVARMQPRVVLMGGAR